MEQEEDGSGIGPEDGEDELDGGEDELGGSEDELGGGEDELGGGSEDEPILPHQQTRNQLRDTIAQAMWVDYQAALQTRQS